MFGWIDKLLFGAPPAPLPTRKVYLGQDADLDARIYARMLGVKPPRRYQSTRELQNGPIDQRFGEDLRATTENVRSLDEWLARIAVLEWEYGQHVPRELWIVAHNDAITTINLYRATLRNTVKRHQRRPSRIYRTSRPSSLA